jgi:hypothetical protein
MGHAQFPLALAVDIEQRQALQEQLPENDAFGQARRQAETDAPGERSQGGADSLLVLCLDTACRSAIAHHNPIDRTTSGVRFALPAFPNHLAINARPHCFGRIRIDRAQEIEIDKGIVERRDQGVGMAMRDARKMAVARGNVDNDEIARV